MGKKVGINQRISINVIETAMKAALDGNYTAEYAADLASGEYQGQNRIAKARGIIGKLTQRNPLFPLIKEHRQEYLNAIKFRGDRAIIFTALINSAYCFGYDTTVILGKFLHVQDSVTTQLIVSRMSSIYGSNRSLPNGLYCVMPMYIEAGLINRPTNGVYSKNEYEISTDFAHEIYRRSFFVNNPECDETSDAYNEHSYFEFG